MSWSFAIQALEVAGHPVERIVDERSTGRCRVARAWTKDGLLWLKEAYQLPPGEEHVLAGLDASPHLPTVVARWPGGCATEDLGETTVDHQSPAADWEAVARALAALCAQERPHIGRWLDLGVRDRRPDAFAARLRWVAEIPWARQDAFRARLPDLLARYVEGFGEATLIHQDAGTCNLRVVPRGVVFFDWADVVVSDPTYACDRLLDDTPARHRERVIAAFCEGVGMSGAAFRAARRSNVLHEAVRYLDETEYLAADPELRSKLRTAGLSQVAVALDHL